MMPTLRKAAIHIVIFIIIIVASIWLRTGPVLLSP